MFAEGIHYTTMPCWAECWPCLVWDLPSAHEALTTVRVWVDPPYTLVPLFLPLRLALIGAEYVFEQREAREVIWPESDSPGCQHGPCPFRGHL